MNLVWIHFRTTSLSAMELFNHRMTFLLFKIKLGRILIYWVIVYSDLKVLDYLNILYWLFK